MLLLLHAVNCCVEFIHRCEDACQHCAFVGGHAVDVVDLIGTCNDTVGCISLSASINFQGTVCFFAQPQL